MKMFPGAAVSVMSFLAVLIPLPAFAAIPLPAVPSWSSSDNDYSTGGAFADVNGDGWIDFLTSNGNDMNMNYNGVYMNHQGTLEAVASWRSADNGYFGHCYAGDVDNDGDVDFAVGYLGSGGSGELTARIYRNEGGTLGTAPWWKAADRHTSFDCCLGDVDNDGDLDLAISAGDVYSGEIDSVRIYRNNGGNFDTLPFWTAHDGTASDAVRFCDIDDDGDLDLFVGQRGRISMYRNNSGVLEETPSWVARTGVGWVLRLALGDYDNDGLPDLAAASNNQLGDPNSIKVYHNNGGTLDTVASFTMLRANRYSSCVAWADVNGDGYADLAAGGWWEPAVVFENHAGVLDTAPTWSWIPSNPNDLVCEAVVWGDINGEHTGSVAQTFDGDGQRKLFNLHYRPVLSMDSVRVNGVRVPSAGFCCDPVAGWFSFAAAPPAGTDNVVCYYRYSAYPDLAVTNWDPSHGNHLFVNTTGVAVAAPQETPRLTGFSAWPNPFRRAVSLQITTNGSAGLTILDAAGRRVRSFPAVSCKLSAVSSFLWDGLDESGEPVAPGVYFAECGNARLKLVRVSLN
jgi:hypothetical protein